MDLHAERLVALLQSTGGEELERVYVLAERQFGLLTNSQGESWHEGVARHVGEGSFSTESVHQKFSVQRKA